MTAADSPPRPIRLAFSITDLEPGGAERALVELVTRLDRQRYEPAVYVLAGPPREELLLRRLAESGIPVTWLGARAATHAVQAVYRLARALGQQRPQLLQTFLFHANLVGRWAGFLAGVPHVVSGIRVAEREQAWHLRLDRWTARLVDKHVCVSQAVADFSRDVAGLAGERLVVIPNGIDVAPFQTATPADLGRLGLNPGHKAIAYIGRLDAQKRVDWLLRLAPRLLEQFATHDLLLVGDGPQRRSLERLAQEMGIGQRVCFTGWRADVPSLLRACELVVLPSAWEGMPNVVLEAMAAARPVVATDVEGVRELLGAASGPQVALVDDADAFRQKCAAILSDQRLAQQLGQENARRAEEAFSLTAMVDAYDRLHRSLLEC